MGIFGWEGSCWRVARIIVVGLGGLELVKGKGFVSRV